MLQVREIIIPLLLSLIFWHVSYIGGIKILNKIRVSLSFGVHSCIASLIGYGCLAVATAVMTLLRPLEWWVGGLLSIGILMLGWRELRDFYQRLGHLLRRWREVGIVEWILIGILGLLFFFYLSTALTPPYQTDALAYHLPEAVSIARNGLHFPVDDNIFYGNLPKLVECLYALMYTLGGFVLIQLTHYQIIILLLGVIFSFLRREFSARAGLVAGVFMFGFYEFMTLATSGYIDGVVLSFELSAILLVVSWIQYKENRLLIIAGILYGFAISSKYLSWYSLCIASFLILSILIKRYKLTKNTLYKVFYFALPIVLIGSGWYIRSAVILHNPFYPFFFGHAGIPDKEFANIQILVGEFMPRTFFNFIRLPFLFFYTKYLLLPFIAFMLFPFGIVIKHNKSLVRRLMIGAVVYMAVWFFGISHQVRFGMVGFSLIVMVGGIVLSELGERLKLWQFCSIHKVAIGVLLVMVGIGGSILGFKRFGTVFPGKLLEWRYIVGRIDKAEYYQGRKYGDLYRISEYINQHFSNTNIINNLNVVNVFLEKNNRYKTTRKVLRGNSWDELCSEIADQKLRLFYTDQTRREHMNQAMTTLASKRLTAIEQTHPEFIQEELADYQQTVTSEEVLREYSIPIFQTQTATLYQLNPSCSK